MRFVPIKNVEQQSVLSLHRVRQGFVKARTAQANQIRGLLGEYGLVVPQGIAYIAQRVPPLIEDAENELPGTFRLLVGLLDTGITEEMYAELTWLIDDAKPVSRHLVGLAISLDIHGTEYLGAALTTGDELDIYPPAERPIEVGGTLAWGAREHVIDTMDIH